MSYPNSIKAESSILVKSLSWAWKMRISGISIVKDGVTLDYPFIESIKSALPMVDEFVVVVGASDDGTREKVSQIGSDKIQIIDTVWDPALRSGGQILAQQTNVGLRAATGDWAMYLQADELLHEKDHVRIREAAEQYQNDPSVDGLLFDYHAFWGYDHTVISRRTYRREIRMVKLTDKVHSYKDAQGFRNYPNDNSIANGHPGNKLRVIHLHGPHIYAYGRVRDAKMELKKVKHIARYWHDDTWIEKRYESVEEWDYSSVDIIKPFKSDEHPSAIVARRTASQLRIQPGTPKFNSLRHRLLHLAEKHTGWRIGEYRNYKKIGTF